LANGTIVRTVVKGTQGVDIRAFVSNVTVERLASRLAVGLLPPQSAVAGPCDSSRDNYYPGHDPPDLGEDNCHESGLSTNAGFQTGPPLIDFHSTVDAGRKVHVIAGSRTAAPVLEHPAIDETPSPYPSLA